MVRVGGVGHDRKPASVAVSAASAALAAALCWTVASLLWRRIPTSLSGAQLNLLKNLIALALQLPLLALVPWRSDGRALLLLALSGAIGIAAGDSLYFAALRRLGTRRTLTLDSGGPAVSTLAGVVLLGEVPRLGQGLGVALISAAVLLEKISVERLAVALRENADEPHADRLASLLAGKFFSNTDDLVRAIDDAAHDESGDTTRRVFQALRIEVNEEFSALDAFLHSAPGCLKAGGRIVVLSFHSGEDRRVKKAFQQHHRDGVFSEISEAVITAGPEERRANPRAIPAKLRFAVKS